ncbi:MAG: glycoside hydrolase family 15 protein [Deltaproteobacteria bacterium]|nr:glycoside hydrolase family 15 protein [Deltaproteobacteria bacterium]
MRLEDLGLVGNCQFSALISRAGAVVWCCLPRFDSEPVFARLLDETDGGEFRIGAADGSPGEQRYLPNTNVLETRFCTADGSFRVLDFAPRFLQYDRHFRPTQLFRLVEPLEGTPRVAVSCEPRLGWSKAKPERLSGSNHVRFEGYASPVRLTTDVPLSYLGGQPFALTERRHLVLSWGTPIEEPLAPLFERFLGETVRYWQRWVKQCNVPPLFQQQVIRSALALKLHCFEDTGAIVASMTTSVPESAGSGRTWDYRYCWLRDAYYSLAAFRRLGQFEERERFVHYLLTVAGGEPDLELAPLYCIDARKDLEERQLGSWPGYEGHGPVRVGNAAARQRQHDVYGEMVLALFPVFLDDRFSEERSSHTLELLIRLARKAGVVAGKPDAGIWEFRNGDRPQTFSSLMCWAAADRLAAVAARHRPELAGEFKGAAEVIRGAIVERAWNAELGSFAASYGGADLDASLLQMVSLHLLDARDPRLNQTVDSVIRELTRGGWLMRYRADDGFGAPTVAFTLCTFWLVEALAKIGRDEEARALLERACQSLSPLGLLSEDYDVVEGRMWGNFPQAYSHVGLINAAFAASPRWADWT